MKTISLRDVTNSLHGENSLSTLPDKQVHLDQSLLSPMVGDKKLGRFIRGACSLEHDSTIEAAVFIALGKLIAMEGLVKFAITAEDIKRVYVNGPQSCMDTKVLMGEIHPCMAYAYPPDRTEIDLSSGNTLAVAYVEDCRGDVIYRAVLCMNSMQYNRWYGPNRALTIALDEMGYIYDGAGSFMDGQRLSKVYDRYDNLLFPYIDGDYDMGTDCGDYIRLGSTGHYESRPDGMAGTPCYCGGCEQAFNEDDLYYCEHLGVELCESCRENYTYALMDRWDCDYVEECDAVRIDYEWYWKENKSISQCEYCQSWYLINDGPVCDCLEKEEEEEQSRPYEEELEYV